MTPVPYFIVFRGAPSAMDSCEFVEVETADGNSIGMNAGWAWSRVDEDYWKLGPFYGPPADPTNASMSDGPVRFLLDGLGVQTISELHALVGKGRLLDDMLLDRMLQVSERVPAARRG